jgi:predicted lactoylglutathione lyase
MSQKIFINLPVSDLSRSTAFYESLGFLKNLEYSDENASSMMWSENIIVMLLKHDFYQKFIGDREIIDPKKSSGALLALTLDSKDAVQQFANTAQLNGGNYYHVDNGASEDIMFGYEVEDPDGHIWEPVWMNPDFNAAIA